MEGPAMILRISHQPIANRTHVGLLAVLALFAWQPRMLSAQDSLPLPEPNSREKLVLVLGAAGTDEYGEQFEQWSEQWQALSQRNDWDWVRIPGDAEQTSPKLELRSAIRDTSNATRLWIVFLGHGTYGQGIAKFNLSGPDVSVQEVKSWLEDRTGPVVFINCSSSSAPFLPDLSEENRIVITSTKNGNEINFSRFGRFLSESVNDLSIDIDHDREVSLLEAFLAASSRTEQFYRDDSRLVTEHALLSDNGDQLGTSANFYQGIRAKHESQDGSPIDGNLASRLILNRSPDLPRFPKALEAKRQAIEARLDTLRLQKTRLPESEYLKQLEALLLELARVYDQAEQPGTVGESTAPLISR